MRRQAACAVLALLLMALGGQSTAAASQQPIDPLISSTDDPLILQQYAIEFFRQNRPDDSLAALRKAAGLYPNNAETRMWLGIVYTRLDELDKASAEFERALELNPGLTEARNWYGLYWMRLGDRDKAIGQYRLALGDPAYPQISRARVLLNLGNALMQGGDYAEATPLLSQAFRTTMPSNDPAFIWIRLTLAEALVKTGRPDEALTVLEELNVLPATARGELLAGMALRDLGEFSRARDRLARVLRLEPGGELAQEAKRILGQIEDGPRARR